MRETHAAMKKGGYAQYPNVAVLKFATPLGIFVDMHTSVS
jgi:hypothetical protein